MSDQCHIVALDAARSSVVVRNTPAGWLLPYVNVDKGLRLSGVVKAALARARIDGTLVHESRLEHFDPAGRRSRYCAVLADRTASAGGAFGPCQWRLVDALLGSQAVLPTQAEALATCLERFRRPTKAFDSPDQISSLREWIVNQLAREGEHLDGPRIEYRLARHNYVVGFPTTRGVVYFKGGGERVLEEEAVTRALRTLAPGHVVETLAFDPERAWWLTRGVIDDRGLSKFSREGAARVVDTLVQIQRQVMASASVRDVLDRRRLSGSELIRALYEIRRLYEDESPDDSPIVSGLREQLSTWWPRIEQACAPLLRMEGPLTWVHPDVWSENVIVSDGRVVFLDLECSYLGLPVLALSRFFDEFTDKPDGAAVVAHCSSRFTGAWRDLIPAENMARMLATLPVSSRLMKALMVLERHVRNDREYGVTSTGVSLRRALTGQVRGLIAAVSESGQTLVTDEG